MKLRRRQFLHLAAGAAALSAVSRVARAQTYPTRPVRLVVGSSAGLGADIVARLIGQWLSERLGQPFIIENKPGAATNIATEAVVKAVPDGYTLLLVLPPNTINATLYDQLNHNFIRDIEPVASIEREPYVVLVHASVTARTIPELIAYAKTDPRKVNMASAGNGTGSHVSGELFKMMTGIDMVHVPYRGGGPALTDLLGGHVQVYFAPMSTCIESVRAGKVRALAVTTATRSDALPGIPTVSEFLPGYETSFWGGIGVPKKTPADIVDKLNEEINTALVDPKMKTRIADLGGTVLPGSPADFGNLIAAETEKWAKVVKFAGIKPD
jgi:tripartite-type tricarboxylate transporter receptor subunit TctC